MLASLVPSLIRTVVALVVGWLIAIPIVTQVGVTSEQLTTLLTAGVTAVYYLAVRLLEQHVSPKFGWLLGLANAPTYSTKLSTAVQGHLVQTSEPPIPGTVLTTTVATGGASPGTPSVGAATPVTTEFPAATPSTGA